MTEARVSKVKRKAPAHGVVKVEETQRDEFQRLLYGHDSNNTNLTAMKSFDNELMK